MSRFDPVLFLLFAFLSETVLGFATTIQRHPPSTQQQQQLFSSRPLIDWVRTETLESILPRDDAVAIISELLNNEQLIDATELQTNKNWDSLEQRFRSEDRSMSDIIGKPATERLLRSVERFEYDPETVRAFLGSDAINNLFAVVLYDAISEFVQKIDIFGNIVNNLPIIGPIRQQITRQFKDSLDRSLGPLIRNFLGVYTKVAVRESIDFVLSPENQRLFGSANVRLVSNVLERPVTSLLPSTEISDKLRDDIFVYLRSDINMDDVEHYLEFVYDVVEDKTVEDFVDVEKVLDASPTLVRTLDRIWDRAKSEDNSS